MHFYANFRRKFENSFPHVLRVFITLAIKVCLQPQDFSYKKAFIHILSMVFSPWFVPLEYTMSFYLCHTIFVAASLLFHYAIDT